MCALGIERLIPNISLLQWDSVARAFRGRYTHHRNREQDETDPDVRALPIQRGFLEEAALS